MGGLREFIYLNGDKFVLTFFWLRSYIIVGMVSYCEPINYILVMVGGAEYTFFFFLGLIQSKLPRNVLTHLGIIGICIPLSPKFVPILFVGCRDPKSTYIHII
jgi:hypothetical protein